MSLIFGTNLTSVSREHVLVDPERALVKAILGMPASNYVLVSKSFLELAHDALTHPEHPLHPGRQGIEMYLGKRKETKRLNNPLTHEKGPFRMQKQDCYFLLNKWTTFDIGFMP